MMNRKQFQNLCEKIATGISIGLIASTLIIFKINNVALAEVIMYDTVPQYKINNDITTFFDNSSYKNSSDDALEVVSIGELELYEINIVGMEDIIYETHSKEQDPAPQTTPSSSGTSFSNISTLLNMSFDDLIKNFYIIDSTTKATEDYFNVNSFLSVDLKTEKTEEPKILLFHSHANEMFIDSNPADINEGIVGAGVRLAEILEEVYGIGVIHIKDEYDMFNGAVERSNAYQRMEAPIKQVLEENPSIEIVIDLHRDGVNEATHLVETINGKETAKIMFFNGISRLLDNGELKTVSTLPNPNVGTNLALSFNMQLGAMEKYPELVRKIYVKPYRYSLHLMPKTLLIEAGAQTNTKEEIYNAMELLAEIINDVLF